MNNTFRFSSFLCSLLITLSFNVGILFADELKTPELPANAPKIISDYGSLTDTMGAPRDKKHNAIDIQGLIGTPIIAAADGKVMKSDHLDKWGYRIVIYHGKNDFDEPFRSVYVHNQKNIAKEGQKVKRGQKIAEMGKCEGCKTAHLHFGVFVGPKGMVHDENPHKYWFDGPFKVTCFDPNRDYSSNSFGLTYPVECGK